MLFQAPCLTDLKEFPSAAENTIYPTACVDENNDVNYVVDDVALVVALAEWCW